MCGYEPFEAEDDQQQYKKIIKGDYQFHSPWWDKIGENAKVSVQFSMWVTFENLKITIVYLLLRILLTAHVYMVVKYDDKVKCCRIWFESF